MSGSGSGIQCDPYQPRPLNTLTCHAGIVSSVAFSSDGHTLVTVSDDATARLGDTNVESIAARICAITWPAISKTEWDRYLPGLAYRPPCP
jgi:WD40 repeat protein